jgi:hypothetical protein
LISLIEWFILSIAVANDKPSNFVEMLISTSRIASVNLHEDLIRSSERMCLSSGRTIEVNGSVARISPSGGFGFWDEMLILNLADRYSPATQADPRCVF